MNVPNCNAEHCSHAYILRANAQCDNNSEADEGNWDILTDFLKACCIRTAFMAHINVHPRLTEGRLISERLISSPLGTRFIASHSVYAYQGSEVNLNETCFIFRL